MYIQSWNPVNHGIFSISINTRFPAFEILPWTNPFKFWICFWILFPIFWGRATSLQDVIRLKSSQSTLGEESVTPTSHLGWVFPETEFPHSRWCWRGPLRWNLNIGEKIQLDAKMYGQFEAFSLYSILFRLVISWPLTHIYWDTKPYLVATRIINIFEARVSVWTFIFHPKNL